MEHTITIHITDDKVTTLPEVDEVIAIANRVKDECSPAAFDVVFQAAVNAYYQRRFKSSLVPSHLQG